MFFLSLPSAGKAAAKSLKETQWTPQSNLTEEQREHNGRFAAQATEPGFGIGLQPQVSSVPETTLHFDFLIADLDGRLDFRAGFGASYIGKDKMVASGESFGCGGLKSQ